MVHLGSVGGYKPPFWDHAPSSATRTILSSNPKKAWLIARALGDHMMDLMNRHGVTAVCTNSPISCSAAFTLAGMPNYQVQAAASGKIDPLSKGDIDFGSRIGGTTTGQYTRL